MAIDADVYALYDDKIFSGSIQGLQIETGTFAFVTSATTADIPTHLSRVVSVGCMPTSASTGGVVELSCDIQTNNGRVSNGLLTITRTVQADTGGSPSVTSAQTFSYTLIGFG